MTKLKKSFKGFTRLEYILLLTLESVRSGPGQLLLFWKPNAFIMPQSLRTLLHRMSVGARSGQIGKTPLSFVKTEQYFCWRVLAVCESRVTVTLSWNRFATG